MEKLLEIKENLEKSLEVGHPNPDFTKAVHVALKSIEAIQDNKKSLGKKVQKIADELVPIIQTMPPLQAYSAIIALLEPHLGDAVDWLGKELAPMKVVDKQGGEVVHDEGQDAPLV